MAERPVYLGRVIDLRTKGASTPPYRYAQVQPLWQSDHAALNWESAIATPVEEFPARGFVFWHHALPTAERGSIWQFGVTEHPNADADVRKDVYQVEAPQQAIEIADLRQTDASILRNSLVGNGILLNPDPIARRILLWIQDEALLGPVQLERLAGTGRWILAGGADPSQLASWRTPGSSINKLIIDGVPRFFLSPGLEFGPSRGVENWSSDLEVAKGVLRRLRKVDRGVADALQVTDQVFREYISTIERAGFLDKDLALDRARGERISELRKRIESDRTYLGLVSEALFESERVQEELTLKVSTAFHELLAAKQAAIEGALSKLRQEAANLDAMIQERQARLTDVTKQLAAEEQELERRVASFDSAMTERLREVAERPEQTFAELAWYKQFLSPGGSSPPPRTLVSSGASRGIAPLPELSVRSEFLAALAKASSSRGLEPLAALDLHATFLTGALPLVVGQSHRAHELLDAYASVVCGGRLLWIPVGATTLEPQDLLARLDVASRRLIPHPGGLLDLILEAKQSNDMFLCVLDGANRAAMESYLLPFIESATSQRKGRNSRAIPIVGPHILASDDPLAGTTRIEWPRNLLLTAIPTNGTSVLPIAADILSRATLIHAAGSSGPPAIESNEVSTVVRIDAWSRWVTDSAHPLGLETEKAFAVMRHQVGVRADELDLSRSLCSVFLSHGFSEREALRRALIVGGAQLPLETLEALETLLRQFELDADPAWSFRTKIARLLSE